MHDSVGTYHHTDTVFLLSHSRMDSSKYNIGSETVSICSCLCECLACRPAGGVEKVKLVWKKLHSSCSLAVMLDGTDVGLGGLARDSSP